MTPERKARARAVIRLSDGDLRLIDRGLGALTSDYNDVPHEDIDRLRKRLAVKVSP